MHSVFDVTCTMLLFNSSFSVEKISSVYKSVYDCFLKNYRAVPLMYSRYCFTWRPIPQPALAPMPDLSYTSRALSQLLQSGETSKVPTQALMPLHITILTEMSIIQVHNCIFQNKSLTKMLVDLINNKQMPSPTVPL